MRAHVVALVLDAEEVRERICFFSQFMPLNWIMD